MTLMSGEGIWLRVVCFTQGEHVQHPEALIEREVFMFAQEQCALTIRFVPAVERHRLSQAVTDRYDINDSHLLLRLLQTVCPHILVSPTHRRRQIERKYQVVD